MLCGYINKDTIGHVLQYINILMWQDTIELGMSSISITPCDRIPLCPCDRIPLGMSSISIMQLAFLLYLVLTQCQRKNRPLYNLAVRAAANDPTAHLTSIGESSTPTISTVLCGAKRRLDMHKHDLSRMERLQIENR